MLSYPHHRRIHGVGTVLHAVFTATGLDVSTKRVLGSQKAQTGSLEHAYRIPFPHLPTSLTKDNLIASELAQATFYDHESRLPVFLLSPEISPFSGSGL